jgi:hypothetical protein
MMAFCSPTNTSHQDICVIVVPPACFGGRFALLPSTTDFLLLTASSDLYRDPFNKRELIYKFALPV